MNIGNGQSQKSITLLPLDNPFIDIEVPLLVGQGKEKNIIENTIHLLHTIDIALALKQIDEDTILSNNMKNMHPTYVHTKCNNNEDDEEKVNNVELS
jgi:hypothetical protein